MARFVAPEHARALPALAAPRRSVGAGASLPELRANRHLEVQVVCKPSGVRCSFDGENIW
jgi:hypothetical protein